MNKDIAQLPSPLARSAMEAIDAAAMLIAVWRLPQALVLLHNAIELMFKGELESIHRALIAAEGKLKYEDLKAILREAFESHPRGAQVKVPDFNFDKTIRFMEALERVRELYPRLLAEWKTRIKTLHDRRNDIVHYGSSADASTEYLELLVLVGFPFVRRFVEEAYGVTLDRLVEGSIARELQVASHAAEAIRADGKTLSHYVLKTVACAASFNAACQPVYRGDVEEVGEDDLIHRALRWRDEFEMFYGVNDDLEWCEICGGLCRVVAFGLVDEEDPHSDVRALAVRCPKCGLNIRAEDAYLAHFHVGPIDRERVDAYLRELG